MNLGNKHIILGSASPRRRELLAGLDIDFEIDTRNDFKEDFKSIGNHREIPVLMAEGKSAGFHRQLGPDEILITADTIVLCSEKAMGKPSGRDEAFGMIREMCGREHEVMTAVTIRSTERKVTFSDVAIVHFSDLSDEEINYYIDRYSPFDKAGAYGIQEWIGYVGIDWIKGSFYTIMGFPVFRVYHELKKFI